MERRALLPGVSPVATPPPVVFDSRKVIVRARRLAALRDTLDLLLLACVDGLFVHWPTAHVPMLGRAQSLQLLLAANVGMFAYLWLARAFPRWRARRVSATWCVDERMRLTKSPNR